MRRMRTGSLTFTCVTISIFCYPTQRYKEYPYTGNKRVTKTRAKQRKISYSCLALVMYVIFLFLELCLDFLLILFSLDLGFGLSKPVSPVVSFVCAAKVRILLDYGNKRKK